MHPPPLSLPQLMLPAPLALPPGPLHRALDACDEVAELGAVAACCRGTLALALGGVFLARALEDGAVGLCVCEPGR